MKCRPANRVPKVKEIETCTSLYLLEQIRLINPRSSCSWAAWPPGRCSEPRASRRSEGDIEQAGRRFLASYHPAVRFYREDLAGR